jgi:uncharacterized protein (TIGR02217 family)
MAPPVLPPFNFISYPAIRRPLWKTLHQESVSGMDNPVPLWTFNRWQYELPITLLNSKSVAFQNALALEWQEMNAFYNQTQGSFGVFQFNDIDDNTVTNQLFGVGDGVTTKFPLTRTMTGAGGFTWNEPVFAPVGTPTIFINGTPTVLFTLGTQGLITFNSAPAGGANLTWTGTYNWLCRFDDDNIDFSKFMSGLWEIKALKFTTIKTQSK